MSNNTSLLPLVILGLVFLAGLAVRYIHKNGIPTYSLRTLLIVITLVAVVLGAVMYATR